jgi:hypothetical protein
MSASGTILNRSPAHSASGDLYWSRRSQINLFGNSQGIVNLYSKIPHCAFQLLPAGNRLDYVPRRPV